MADYFDSPDVEVQKYDARYLRYMLTLRLSLVVREAIEHELKCRGELPGDEVPRDP